MQLSCDALGEVTRRLASSARCSDCSLEESATLSSVEALARTSPSIWECSDAEVLQHLAPLWLNSILLILREAQSRFWCCEWPRYELAQMALHKVATLPIGGSNLRQKPGLIRKIERMAITTDH